MRIPNVFIRGALGDLIVLLPIAKGVLEEKFGTDICNLIYNGPLNQEVLAEFISMVRGIKIKKVFQIRNIHPSHTISRKNYEEILRDHDIQMDVYLNHCSWNDGKFTIEKASNLYPEIDRDYCSVGYKTRKTKSPHHPYVVVSPVSNSNPNGVTAVVAQSFNRIIQKILRDTDHQIYLIGRCSSINDLWRYYPPHLKDNSGEIGRIIPYFNATTLTEAVTLINNARGGVFFDNGLKNFSFLSNNSTCFVFDPSWKNANPIEAWMPEQFQAMDNKFVVDLSEDHVWQKLEIGKFVERIV